MGDKSVVQLRLREALGLCECLFSRIKLEISFLSYVHVHLLALSLFALQFITMCIALCSFIIEFCFPANSVIRELRVAIDTSRRLIDESLQRENSKSHLKSKFQSFEDK